MTRLALRLIRATPYVRIRYLHFASVDDGMAAMEEIARLEAPTDFMDAVALSQSSTVAVLGWLAMEAPSLPLRSLRANRWDVWFAWHLHALARRLPALESVA